MTATIAAPSTNQGRFFIDCLSISGWWFFARAKSGNRAVLVRYGYPHLCWCRDRLKVANV